MNRNSFCIILFLGILIISCQAPISGKEATTGDVLSIDNLDRNLDPEQLASRYTTSVVVAYERFSPQSPRSLSMDSATPIELVQYFDNLKIEGPMGEKLRFSEMPVSEKMGFLQYWKRETTKSLADNVRGMHDSLTALSDINDSLEYALAVTRDTDEGFDKFSQTYNQNYADRKELREKALLSSRSSRSMGAPTTGSVANSIYLDGFYKIKNAYEQGNIIATDTNGASPLGHASMFSETAWNPQWEATDYSPSLTPGWPFNPSSKISLSSYLSDGPYQDTEWGVSRESIHWWVDHSNWIKHVKIFQPGEYVWVWDWANSGVKWRVANSTDRAKAVANAFSHLHKPYSQDWLNRDRTDQFYCSQIVWRAWYDVNNHEYDFCAPLIPGIAPTILMQSDKLRNISGSEYDTDTFVPYYRYVGDVNGDGRADHIRITAAGFASSGKVEVALSAQDGSLGGWNLSQATLDSNLNDGVFFTDVNGDGNVDLVVWPRVGLSNAGRVYVGLSNGRTFQDWVSSQGLLDADVNDDVRFADVNGDGKSDLIAIPPAGRGNSGRVYVGLSTGTSFQAWTWSAAMLDASNDTIFLADVNGDGKSDLVALPRAGLSNAGRVYVGLSNGTGFQAWTSSVAMLDGDVNDDVRIADVNGDGKSDLIAIPPAGRGNSGRLYVGLSTWTSFQAWTWNGAMLDASNDSIDFTDVNGDGKSDLVVLPRVGLSNAGRVYVGLSNGTGFPGWTSNVAMLDGDVNDEVYFADINGDGRKDMIAVPPQGRQNAGQIYLGTSQGTYFQSWTHIASRY